MIYILLIMMFRPGLPALPGLGDLAQYLLAPEIWPMQKETIAPSLQSTFDHILERWNDHKMFLMSWHWTFWSMYDCTVPLNFMLLSSAFTSFYLPQQYLHLFLSASTIYLRFTRRLANKLPRWTRPCLKRSTTTNPLYHPQQYPQNYPQFILV